MICKYLTKFINEYNDVYQEVWKSQNFKHPLGEYVRKDIADKFRELSILKQDRHVVKASCGAGKWTSVPWIAIFDNRITKSAQKGIYIVYLLNKDSKELYLTLNQGASGSTLSELENNAKNIREQLGITRFEKIQTGSDAYDAGCICSKKYTVSDLNDSDEFLEDLAEFIKLYEKYYSLYYNNSIFDKSTESGSNLIKDKFRKWFAEQPQKNNKDINYSANTIDAAVRLLETGFSKLGLNKYANLNCFDITSYSEFKVIRDECYGLAEKFDKSQFHSDFRNGLDFYLLFLKELSQFKELLEIFVRQLKINNDIIPGEKIYGQGYKDMPKIQNIYKHCREFDGYVLEINLQAGFHSYDSSNYINLRETWINIVPLFQETPEGNHDVNALQVVIKPDNKVANDYPEETIDALGLFDKQSPNINLINFFSDFKYEIDKYKITMNKEGEKEMTINDKINAIKTYISAKGFNYEGDLIENFYLSLKSKPFVILAGTSGTGKTRLVKLFAEAIGAEMKLVPVRPDWSDSSDLFGHTDLSNNFHPGAIIDFIKKAEWNKDKPFFLCLDEMNLARVEYYLSDFLSIIETRDRKENGDIETDALVDVDYYKNKEAQGKYGRVFIPENLYIIGTVNMDETTFPFSKKVLDRANTIEFSFVNLMSKPKTFDAVPQKLNEDNSFLKTEYLYLRDCSDSSVVDNVCFDLEELNQILVKANLHVGYRVRDEITFYMMNNKKTGLLLKEDAFDHEIMQKILPRVQGSSAAIKDVLSELFVKCAGDFSGFSGVSTFEQMNSYIDQKDCKYPNSAKKIAFMMRRYEEDGFTSYWL